MQPSQGPDLLEELAQWSTDPAGFILWAFPWGEPGTVLAGETGPQAWQWELACEIRDWIASGRSWQEAFRMAIASGHGIGKSADVSWMILWAFATHEDTRGIVTANTEAQLRTKTWVELSKWFHLFIARELFDLQSTKLCARDPEHADTWRIDRVTWSDDNTEAFAGLHNKGKRILVVFDEASAIPEKIFEVTNGALTDADTQIIWLIYGNPTRNSGPFFDAFHSRSRWWRSRQIDSRAVAITNKREIGRWIEEYGLDSDYVRVRVLGQFPRTGALEFIGRDLITGACARLLDPESVRGAPLVLGVDVARQGEDSSVLFFRRGLDARSIPPVAVHTPNLMTFASHIVGLCREHRVDAVFVDEGGLGAGLVDRLRQLRLDVFGVQFGARADLPAREGEGLYKNKRSEMYGSVRRWLSAGAIPNHDQLVKELGAPMYSVDDKDQIVLEKKKDIRARLGFSPDHADALALTFAYPVFPKADLLPGRGQPLIATDYDPFSRELMEA